MLKIISRILNTVSLCVWVISVVTMYFLEMREAVDKKSGARKQPQLAQILKKNGLFYNTVNSSFLIFGQLYSLRACHHVLMQLNQNLYQVIS